jgi:hypothetical protein
VEDPKGRGARPDKAFDELTAEEQTAVVQDWANRFAKAFAPFQKFFDALGVTGRNVGQVEGVFGVAAGPLGNLTYDGAACGC